MQSLAAGSPTLMKELEKQARQRAPEQPDSDHQELFLNFLRGKVVTKLVSASRHDPASLHLQMRLFH